MDGDSVNLPTIATDKLTRLMKLTQSYEQDFGCEKWLWGIEYNDADMNLS